MWFTRHSLRRQSEDSGQVSGDRKRCKSDQRVELLLYRKSKLESASETSAVLSGFAIVSLQFFFLIYSENDFRLHSLNFQSILIQNVHLLALLMSVCILPEIKSVLLQKNQWIKHKNQEPLSVSGFSFAAAIAAIATLCLIGIPFIIFAVGFYIRVVRAKLFIHKHDFDAMERGAMRNNAFQSLPSTATLTTIVENS
ncbi:unnamed protein product [Adineta ricciae]|uniref:Uncharacterized protein n=1 Tax=Adineta ricciae TaxID=249248 RepID=A0A814QQX9_ADIRI|nr:unnamed protein product [Adineta ricciae]